jgi:small multidrug resistance pump
MIYKILLFLSIASNVVAQITLKYGAKSSDIIQKNGTLLEKIASVITPYFVMAAFFYGISFLAYSVVLSKMEISKAYPISVISAVILILLISALFLQENISALKIIGISFCILGVFLIFYK